MKKKIYTLLLPLFLILVLNGCGSQVSNTTSRAINNEETSILATKSDETRTKNSVTDGDEKTAVGDGNASDSNQNVVQNQETNQQSSLNQQTTQQQTTQQQTTQQQTTQQQTNGAQTNTTTQQENSIVVIGDGNSQAKAEEPTKSAVVESINDYHISPNITENNFGLISATGKFKNEAAYIQYLQDSGARKVSTTQEAIDIINGICASAELGINLCFSKDANIDIQSLINALPQDVALARYIDVNIWKREYMYSDFYFGAKLTWWTTPKEEIALNNLVTQMLPSLNVGSTYDKIKNVHDYISNNVNYSYETLYQTDNNFSAYDALFGKKAVCQGYALAFKKFMDAMGIQSYIGKGQVNTNSTNGLHAWNVVLLNDQWYSVDCTWDGQDDNTNYKYFLLGVNEYPYGVFNGSSVGISLAPSKYIK